MDKVRMGVIGLGNMGAVHSKYLQAGEVARCELTAVCDVDSKLMAPYENVKKFADSAELIRSGAVDAVLIATPHYDHTTIGIDALEQGLHVLTEKPISVHKADCERLVAAHTNKDLVFGVMFQLRTEPQYRKLKEVIERGELGTIQRTNWIITTWFRSEAYYASGGWRATWRGEGGGVLLNQSPHTLDIFQWVCGMPSRVYALCDLGRHHNIEVEDDVHAIFEYPNGARGTFVTGTGEAPGTNRLEIVGDRGRIVLEHGKITFTRTEESVSEFSKTTRNSFGSPGVWHIDIPVPKDPGGGSHVEVTRRFVNAILDGTPLVAGAEEGIHSVELANAMLYSAFTGQPVDVPLDGAAYEAKLKELIANSRFEKKVEEADVDFQASYMQ